MRLENPWNDPAVPLFPPQILCVLAWDWLRPAKCEGGD